jgi:putative ABC transport system permease protein
MPVLLSIALRNTLRHRRRTLLTGAAIVLGVAAAVFLDGWVNGFLDLILRNADTGTGAIQVHHRGWRSADADPLQLDLPEDPALLARLASLPGVTAVTPRIGFEALVGNGTAATLGLVTAIDLSRELAVCPERFTAARSAGLSGRHPDGAVLGRALGEALGAGTGGSLTLLATTRAGASNALDIEVESLAGTTTPLDSKRMVVVALPLAQELLGMKGRVTEYALAVERLDEVEAVARAARTALGEDYEVATWWDLLPQIVDAFLLTRAVLGVILGVLLVLAASGIASTMLMAVHERVREIGTLLALGVRRRRVLALFLVESGAIGLAGGALGAGVGSLLVVLLHRRGIAFPPPGSDVAALLRPWAGPGFVLATALAAALGAVLAALYPAWKASRLTPADALRAV